jgi:hypothetical protein
MQRCTYQHGLDVRVDNVDDLADALGNFLCETEQATTPSSTASTYGSLEEHVDDVDSRHHRVRLGGQVGDGLDVGDDRSRVDGRDEAGEGGESDRGEGEELHGADERRDLGWMEESGEVVRLRDARLGGRVKIEGRVSQAFMGRKRDGVPRSGSKIQRKTCIVATVRDWKRRWTRAHVVSGQSTIPACLGN